MTLLRTEHLALVTAWGLLVVLCGPQLVKTHALVNVMLKYAERLFVAGTDDVKAATFTAWAHLVMNFSFPDRTALRTRALAHSLTAAL